MRLLSIALIGIVSFVVLLTTLNFLLQNNIVPPSWPFLVLGLFVLIGVLAFHLKSIIPLIVIIVSGIVVLVVTGYILNVLFPNPEREVTMGLNIWFPALVIAIITMVIEAKLLSKKTNRK